MEIAALDSLPAPRAEPLQSCSSALLYNLHLDRVRLRAIAARHRRDDELSNLEETRRELARVDEMLDQARRDGIAMRDVRLAKLLQLSDREVDLLWSVVGATVDPALGVHIRDLAGGEARHGISLALHAFIAELDHSAARALAISLTPLHPLLRYGLLELAGDGVLSARPFSVPTRVAAFLAGEDTIDPMVERVGGVIRIEHEPSLDRSQLECVKQITRALTDDPDLIVIEGPIDVGKRTAAGLAALAVRQRIVEIDAARMPDSIAEFERAFIALRRECLLVDAIPLVANIDHSTTDEVKQARLQMFTRLLDETPIPVIVTSSVAGIDLGIRRRVGVRTLQHRCRSPGLRRTGAASPTTIVGCRNSCLTLMRRGPTTTPEPFSLRGGEPSNRWARSHARTEWSRTASTGGESA